MTADTTAPTDDLTAEVTAWLEDNWDPDLTVEEWWDRLGRSGWAVAHVAGGVVRQGAVARRGRARDADDQRVPARSVRPAGSARCSRARRSRCTAPRSRRSATSSTSSPASRRGASSSASPAPAPTSPASTPVPSSTATSGSSTGRRCGRRAATGPTSACCSPAPTPTCPSTRASPTSPSTCTSPASRSGRCARSPAARCSTRCSSPTCACPTDAAIGGVNNGWAVANTTLMFERSGLGAGGGGGSVAALPGHHRRRPRPSRRRLQPGPRPHRLGWWWRLDVGAEPHATRPGQRHHRRSRHPPVARRSSTR